jgi:hypothetical protein
MPRETSGVRNSGKRSTGGIGKDNNYIVSVVVTELLNAECSAVPSVASAANAV